MKALIAHPTDHKAVATKLASAMVCTLHHLFFTFGEDDSICLIEAPDDTPMMAVSAILAASGTDILLRPILNGIIAGFIGP